MNSVSSGTLSLITYRNIVTKTYFPREIIPLAQVCSRFIDFFAAAALYAMLMVAYGVGLGVWALMAPVFFVLLMLFTVGFTFATSAVNVFYRDVNPVVQIALQLWLYLTPVAYPLALVPARFRLLFVLNPLSAIVEGLPRRGGLQSRARLAADRRRGDDHRRGVRRRLRHVQADGQVLRRRHLTRHAVGDPARAGHQALSRRPIAHGRRSGRRRASIACAAARDDVHSATRGKIDATIWALRDVELRRAGGRRRRRHRPQRRGQDHAAEADLARHLADQRPGPRRRTRRVADRARRRISSRADRPRERLSRRRSVRADRAARSTGSSIASSQFADVERLIDTPMKRYSSGLYARLGFSVAIHSNPDIVLVDEVLAVGDAAFRRRALEALRQLIADGKTVLFISHDMWNVRRLCDQILWMEEGRVRAYGAGRRDRRALHERGERRRRWRTRRPRCRAIAAAPARSATPRSICSTRRGQPDRADRGRATTLVVRASVPRRAAGRAAGVPGRRSSTSTPAW